MTTAVPRPPRGAYTLKRLADKADLRTNEKAAKVAVRKRDRRRCRWPHCRHTRLSLHVAHLTHKGMGGDPTGERSLSGRMILLCYLHHYGDKQQAHQEGSLDRGDLQIEPETAAGTWGPCAFSRKGDDGEWYLVARELAPFVLERI